MNSRFRDEPAQFRVLPWWLAAALLGCGGAGDGGVGDVVGLTGRAEQAIIDGDTDRERVAVVSIATLTDHGSGLCTGSLIAPNLVLTARHCVVPMEDALVVCGSSMFAAPYAAGNLWVSAAASVFGAQLYPVREIAVPSEMGALCGSDIALLILDGQFSERIKPFEPRLDPPAESGEPYTAVGFGDAQEDGAAGLRRVREELEIVCGPNDCGAPAILTETEFVGARAVCEGDSGGPALDVDERIVGVASRAGEGCGWSIYSAVHSWGEFIVTVAERALAVGDYEPPLWLAQATAEETGIDDLRAARGEGALAPQEPPVEAALDAPDGAASELGGARSVARSGCSVSAPGGGLGKALPLGNIAGFALLGGWLSRRARRRARARQKSADLLARASGVRSRSGAGGEPAGRHM